MDGIDGKRILLTGARDFDDDELLALALFPYNDPFLIIGYDPVKDYPSGLDRMAYKYAISANLGFVCYPYHYQLGKAGGGSRNQQMLDEGMPDIVHAFPTASSKGTWDMVRRAKKVGVEVFVHQR